MAEEKQTTSDLDDWLEDLDDSDEFSSELGQDNIDAMLSGGLESGGSSPEPAAAPAADNAGEEMDQDNIDALLSSSLDLEDGAEAKSAAAPAADNAAKELDQDNIDALLSGSLDLEDGPEAKSAAAPAADNATKEMDQDNIDLLLGADDDEFLQDVDSEELDQDNIDALMRGGDKQEKESASDAFLAAGVPLGVVGAGDGLDVDQDEIDQLFSGLDDDEIEEPFSSEEIDLVDALAGDDDSLVLGDAGQENNNSSGEATVAGEIDDMDHEIFAHGQGAGGFLPFLPEAINKTVAAVIAVCLVIFFASGLYFFRPGPKKEPAIPMQGGEPVVQLEEPQPQAVVNYIPMVSDSLYSMPETGGEVPVTLTAKDNDGDTITYEVTNPPRHGHLSGDAPSLVYLPNNDFPGEDRFEYKASDGKDSSGLAKVIITGPNLAKLAEEQEKEKAEAAKIPLQPSRPEVYAKNMTYDTTSTDNVIIDWGRIWRDANHKPFSSKVFVDVDDSHLKGSLSKVDDGKYIYRPDPSFAGKDVLHYRFKRGGLSSGLGKVTMRVRRGDLPPEIRIDEMARAYMVGETVRIDASPTRDEARSKLSFRWEQTSGVPVQIKMNNEEGSIISFAMPSSFYTSTEPGAVLRVTAVDASGQRDSKEIKVRAISRRKSALWGMADNDMSQSGSVRLR